MSDQIQRITVFTGSAAGNSTVYLEAVQNFARVVADAGYGIVFGGGHVGLMGALADAALNAGTEVIGVMPRSLVNGEIAHEGLTSLEIVEDMHARKLRMAELGDAFVALPGGAGTLEELFEAWTWQQLGIHTHPVALYNVAGFWDPLISMVEHMTHTGFIRESFQNALIVAQDPHELLTALARWKPPAAKWTKQLGDAQHPDNPR
ncbi:MAG TPA: TIGR00730 family Rossman fold protein [Candidatus Yaniella excrementavium]|nr:TIGR00730 family Rossman fold protein [Candidatus Yaniella excrementavium]